MSFLSSSGLLGRRTPRSRNASRSPSASPVLPELRIVQPSETDLNTLSPLSGAFRSTRLDCRMRSGERDASAEPGRETWEEPVDLSMLDYVNEPDTNLTCPICRSPFVDPIALSDCEHCFCRDCLRQTWSQQAYSPGIPKGKCPTCRRPNLLPSRASVSRILVNILDDLLVKCPNHEDGCQDQVKRGEVQEHVRNYCEYTQIACPGTDCERRVKRKDGKECQHFGVACLSCREETDMASIEAHWKTDCAARTVTCEHCQEEISSRDEAHHKEIVCLSIMQDCSGSPYGCPFKSARDAMAEHTKSCTIASLAPFFEAQAKRLKSAEDQNTFMTRRINILEGSFRTLQDTLSASPRTDIFASDTQATAQPTPTTAPPADIRVAPPPEAEEPFTSPYTHLLSLHESLREEFSRVSAALADLDARHSMLILNENLRLKEDMSYLAGQIGGLGRQVGWLTSTRLQEQSGGNIIGRTKL